MHILLEAMNKMFKGDKKLSVRDILFALGGAVSLLIFLDYPTALFYSIVFMFFVVFTEKFFKDKIFRTKAQTFAFYIWITLIVLIILDTITTHYGINYLNLVEANNFAVLMWERYGFTLGTTILLTIKILFFLFISNLCQIRNKHLNYLGFLVLTGYFLHHLFSVSNNIYLILKLTTPI